MQKIYQMNANQEVYYHDRLKEQVTIVVAPNQSGYVIVRKSSDGKMVSTHESHLKPLLDMSGDEILRREG